ncbi:cytochrome b5-like heme/steroid binding domain-containing protein [Cantharellus anzutake]|uniref:cytochrome b5-like heme/steroid binding domain-containing protein n=1 Tax=Cantharellus anzutake TaxID=1750568 RepID=UPI00190842AE|nr:cytochrome b5-like heme/steroid binding domain-containing protein [Cantharellus anzutake]KAF8340311.1 cytochrome b5-like heme/steroid binding domain-containing protein [Cantharellus anzutake]
METNFRRWLASLGVSTPSPTSQVDVDPSPALTLNVSPPPVEDDEDDGDATETDDRPPAFPALGSIQRSQEVAGFPSPSASGPTARAAAEDSRRMPPPSFLPLRLGVANGTVAVGSSSSGGLALPPSTTKPPPNVNKKAKVREKVALAPGHSSLDWARLKASGTDLRAGVTILLRITPSELKLHNKHDDAWAAFGGKVYNITPFLPFHPGGEKELLRVAGRDGSRLFALTHSWVNLDYMLDGCVVGLLVKDR